MSFKYTINLPASPPLITLWSYDKEMGRNVFSVIFPLFITSLFWKFDSARIATSGGLIIGVKPNPPIFPRLDTVKVDP